ncbi:MAG: glycosyltransferase family 39 protein [bacterium]|nr:glycosyltransferase family 39 protein [bacterium]
MLAERGGDQGSTHARLLWPIGPALLLSLVSFAVFVWIVMQRAFHPFELEWMEGGSLQHLVRLREGLPLYGAPSLDFVPYPYPPLYYYAAIPFASVFGSGFLALRAVSILASFASAFFVFSLVRLETRRGALGLVAAGLYLATYRISGAYMDVARLDSFFVALVLAAVWVLRSRDDALGWAMAGVLAFLATMTKQTGFAVFAPLFVWCLYRDRVGGSDAQPGFGRTLGFSATTLLLTAIGLLVLDLGENNHFLRYVIGAQSGHEIRWSMIPYFFWNDLFLALPLGVAITAAWCWRSRDRTTVLFYLAFFVGIVAACIVPRIKVGGAMNNLIPLHACLVLLAGIAFGRWFETASSRPHTAPLVALGLVAQFAWLVYDPRIASPHPGDAQAGARFVNQLRAVQGEVLIPAHGYLAAMAGKRVYAHQMPVDDIDNSGLAGVAALRGEFTEAIAARRFALIVDSASRFLESYPDDRVLREHYEIRGPVFDKPGVLIPRSGWQVGPGRVWAPRNEQPPGAR